MLPLANVAIARIMPAARVAGSRLTAAACFLARRRGQKVGGHRKTPELKSAGRLVRVEEFDALDTS